jgi:hypothetical protein
VDRPNNYIRFAAIVKDFSPENAKKSRLLRQTGESALK